VESRARQSAFEAKGKLLKILVTGGAGFLGSHLCDKLISQGHEVYCVDNLYTGRKSNIEHLLGDSNFQFIEQDVTKPIELNVNQIYNLASPASPVQYQKDPVLTFKTNILGALSVLELARTRGSRVLQASTSEVYGDPAVNPQPENYWGNVNPIGIRACYDEGKRGAETLFFDYWRQYGLEVKVARIFNTYGPRMHPDDGRVISNFIAQALKGSDLTVFGDGSQTRAFCYVDDLVRGLILLMNSDRGIVGPMNLGNPEEFSVIQLAEQILQKLGSKSSISFSKIPLDDPKQRRPDIFFAEKTLGWKPQVNLQDGLDLTMDYFRSNEILG
jgi:UDP-glucuronate decarboxylase